MQTEYDGGVGLNHLTFYTIIFTGNQYEQQRTPEIIKACFKFCRIMRQKMSYLAIEIRHDVEKLEKNIFSLYSPETFPEYYI